VERLKECFVMAETALDAMDGGEVDVRAATMVTRAKLVGELNFFVSFVEFFSH
jgi:hypothetical protein